MRNDAPPVSFHSWCHPLPDDDARDQAAQLRRLQDAAQLAVMPDAHAGALTCNGVALATRVLLYPQAVGSDMGCGYLWIALDGSADALARSGEALLEAIGRSVPILRHPRPLAEHLRLPHASDPALDRVLKREGLLELGTLGRGNHFIELQRDAHDGRCWLLVHSGSRVLGQAFFAHHLGRAHGASEGLSFLRADTPEGKAFLHDHHLARAFARLNRTRMAQTVLREVFRLCGLRPDLSTLRHSDHNHVARERIGGEWLWVHRKGASRAEAGRAQVIPGSMGTATFHVLGRGEVLGLNSCAHGGGRLLARGEAGRKLRLGALRETMAGIHWQHANAMNLLSESPQAYKEIGAVLRAQRDLVRQVRMLEPVVNFKGI